ncbi:MAG: efflux RND transporter periplasmic adaptor subunit [Acidobacteriota bacterium]
MPRIVYLPEVQEVVLLRKLLFLLVAVSFFSLLGFRLYQELAPAAMEPSPGGGLGRPALLVETAVAEPREFHSPLEVLGELKAQASVEVMSRISGRLERVLVDRGDAVNRGQLVAVVEDSDLRQQIRRSDAAIAVARAGQKREQATVENLKIQLRRFRSLHEEDLISVQDLQDLESRVRVAESQLELATAQVEQAEAALKELKIEREQTRIFSPLEGVVGTRYLEPGALVSPSVAIVSVLNLNRVKTIMPVPERTLGAVRVGLPAQITVDAYPDKSYHGVVTRISPFLDPETRSAEAEIEIPNPGRLLKPGMFARVRINVNFSHQALAIPRAGLLIRGEEQGVFRLTHEMKTVFQKIQVGRIEGDFVETIEGLDPGAEIVTTGAQSLNEGDAVRVRGENGPGM